MIKIYYARVSVFIKVFNQSIDLLKSIPVVFHKKALTYVRSQDQFSFIIGRLLIMKLLNDFGYNSNDVSEIKRTEHDKPYFNNLLKFNLSHSGDYVICCGSTEQNLGIDIEQVRQLDISDFRTAFSVEDWEMIDNAPDSWRIFFDLWTKKESVIKADGRGLSVDLKRISIKDNKGLIHGSTTIWHLKSIFIDKDYSCYICSDKEITTLAIEEFQVNMINK